jgi:RNA polymerase subunit RPABC4/transcription elongation factor Spt4
MFETKEQVLEKVINQDKPVCPHCGQAMSIWEAPDVPVGDGLGWGTPYLFMCVNDSCSLYEQGWQHMKETYAHNCSYRCICYPGTSQFELMPVFSPVGATGQIIDDEVVLAQERLKEATKKGFSILANCFVEKDYVTVMRLLTDPAEPSRVRLKAAEMMGDIGDTEVIETLRNCKFGYEVVQKQVDESINKIHDRFFTRECPFCAEVVKKRANVCKHCGKDIAGE